MYPAATRTAGSPELCHVILYPTAVTGSVLPFYSSHESEESAKRVNRISIMMSVNKASILYTKAHSTICKYTN
jgi:hypothetical protein